MLEERKRKINRAMAELDGYCVRNFGGRKRGDRFCLVMALSRTSPHPHRMTEEEAWLDLPHDYTTDLNAVHSVAKKLIWHVRAMYHLFLPGVCGVLADDFDAGPLERCEAILRAAHKWNKL